MRSRVIAIAVLGLVLLANNRFHATPTTITVCDANCTTTNLQTALNTAVGGDLILLQQGKTYTGNFTLPIHSAATTEVMVRTGVTATGVVVSTSVFPAANIRMTPALAAAANLAKIVVSSNNVPAIRTDDPSGGVGPAYWHLKWFEVTSNTYGGAELIRLGSDSSSTQTVNAEIPDHFVLEQLYVHGNAVSGQFRGIGIHSNNVTLQDSTIVDIKAVGSAGDGQALWINSSTGPYTITNNKIEGGAESVLIGGSAGCCRPSVTIASASSATAFTLSAHTDLHVGQGLTVENGSAVEEFTEIATCGVSTDGAACTSNSVTVTPALSGTPSVGADVDWGTVPQDLTFTKNLVTRPVAWRNPIVGTPQSVIAVTSASGGAMTTGTYGYRVVARHPAAVNTIAQSTASAEVIVSISSGTTGSIAISWAPVTNATNYDIYGRSPGGENIKFSVTTSACGATACSYTDTGSGGTTASVPTTTGTTWFEKNSFEIKNLDRATIDGNIFENVWLNGQTGYAILLTVANTGNGNDSTRVRHISFTHNIVRHAAGGIQITGRDVSTNKQPSARSIGDTISGNLFYDISSDWGASDRMILITTSGTWAAYPGLPSVHPMGPKDLTVDHNTFVHPSGNASFYLDLFKTDEKACEHCLVTNNIFYKVGFGLTGNNSCTQGDGCWTAHTTGSSSWLKDLTADAVCSAYPGGTAQNFCPSSAALNAEFQDYAQANFALKATSVYKRAGTDGADLGANISAITPLTNIALTGDNTGTPPPVPPSITTLMVAGGQVASPYSASLTGTCASAPCTWTISGSVVGVALTGTSSTTATFAGTPTTPGTYTVTVTLTDTHALTASQPYTLTIADIPPPPPPDDDDTGPEAPRAERDWLNEGAFFRRPLDPSVATDTTPKEPVRKLDTWGDLSCGALKVSTDTSPSVTWTALALRPQLVVSTKNTAGVVTYTAAELIGGLILRDPNGAGRSDVTPTATQIVAAIPCASAGDTFEFDIRNTADANETITLTAGTDVTLSGTMTIAQNNTKRFKVVVTDATTPAVTIYAIGTFVH
jgi:hypothetical protein